MKKFLYSGIGKVIVIAAMLASITCVAISAAWMISGLSFGMQGNVLQPQLYPQTTEVVNGYLIPEVHDFLDNVKLSEKYLKKGTLDKKQTIDISDLNAGINNKKKTPELTYTLEELIRFQESAGYVYLNYLLNNRYSFMLTEDQEIEDGNTEEVAVGSEESLSDDGTVYASDENAGVIGEDNTQGSAFGKKVYGPKAKAFERRSILYQDIVTEIESDDVNPKRSRNGDERVTFYTYDNQFNVLYNNGLSLEKKYIRNATGGMIADYALANLDDVSILDCYTYLLQAAKEVARLNKEGQSGSSNAVIWLKRSSDGKVFTNYSACQSMDLEKMQSYYEDKLVNTAGEQDEDRIFIAYDEKKDSTSLGGGNQKSMDALVYLKDIMLKDTLPGVFGANDTWQLFVGLNTNWPVKDSGQMNNELYDAYKTAEPFGQNAIPAAIIAAACFIFTMILTILQTGHNSRDNEIHTTPMERFPIELLFVKDIILWLVWLGLSISILGHITAEDSLTTGHFFNVLGNLRFLMIPSLCAFAILLCWDLKHYVRRIKAKTLGGSLIRSLYHAIKKVTISAYRTKKEGQRLVIAYIVLIGANAAVAGLFGMIAAYTDTEILVLVCILILFIVNLFILRMLLGYFSGRDAVRKGMDEIAAGNLDYKVDTSEISGYNREMAEGVNLISAGFKNAVEAEIKSERMKAELITNVSHDIKTPLTSIINYVDILKRCSIEDDEVRSYIEILDRKSARLKQLIDDLVESSKISTGNIKLDMNRIDFGQLLQQMNGEYREKFEERNLELVSDLPDEPMMVYADGARLYRVIDNLYNNAVKYAMPGTRVYVDGEIVREESMKEPVNDSSPILEQSQEKTDHSSEQVNFSQGSANTSRIVITMKNISKFPLNISSDELMERFVRGDLSRSTEGSGLGLEIARNLTVMQDGKLDIYLDGDLFKVVLEFPYSES